MTLVELLIVVTVMVMLMGLALPLMKTGLGGRKVREAGRQLNSYVQLATSIAAETGRPSGLLLQVQTLPENGLPYVTEVYLAQTPLPYGGDSVLSRATITTISGPPIPTATATFDAFSGSLNSLVRVGDSIKFDYRGPMYDITAVGVGVVTFQGWPLPPDSAVLPYQVFRQPEKSSSAPMQLVAGAVIDLSMSGFGLIGEDRFDNAAAETTESVLIVFNPSGSVARVLVTKVAVDNNGNVTTTPYTYTPTETLHLLLGSIEGVQLDDIVNVNTADDIVTNIENPEGIWVSISHLSGRATTAENGWTIDAPFAMNVAREFAQSGKAMGGR